MSALVESLMDQAVRLEVLDDAGRWDLVAAGVLGKVLHEDEGLNAERDAVIHGLMEFGSYTGGGGAAPVWRVSLDW